MRTKTLLSLAALAASVVAASAANVYSLNTVGYINATNITVALHTGLNMLENPLSTADLTGTNDTVANTISNQLPLNTTVYTWNGTGYNIASYSKGKVSPFPTNWGPVPLPSLNPGQGAWIQIPSNATPPFTLTWAGNVMENKLTPTGNLPNNYMHAGLSLLGSVAPLGGGITTVLQYQPRLNDTVYQWNGTGYTINSYTK